MRRSPIAVEQRRTQAHRMAVIAAGLSAASVAFCIDASRAVAHTQVQSALSVAIGAKGQRWLAATSSGLLRSSDAAKTFSWQCAAGFGSTGKLGLQRRVFLWGDMFVLLEEERLQRSVDGCAWTPGVAGVPSQLLARHVSASGKQTAWVVGDLDGQRRLYRSVAGQAFVALQLKGGFEPLGAVALGSDGAGLAAGHVGEDARVATIDPAGSLTLLDAPDATDITPLLAVAPAAKTGPDGLWLVRASGTFSEQLLVSRDRAKTWEMVHEIPPGDPFMAAAWLPQAPTPTLLVTGHESRVLRSVDLGKTFQQVPNSPHSPCLRRQGDLLYACADGILDQALIKKSSDYGITWQTVTCMGLVAGPGVCGAAQSTCSEQWPWTLESHAAKPGTCAPTALGGPDAGVGTSDGGAWEAGSRGGTDASSGSSGGNTGTGGEITTVPADDGCAAAPVPAPPPWWLITLCGLAWGRRRVGRSP